MNDPPRRPDPPFRRPAPSLQLRIESNSAIPPFEQIRAQISLLVASGRLKPRDRLPTIRALSAQLELASGTVARAYRELERTDVLISRGRAGTFVADEPSVAFAVVDRQERLDEAARRFAHDALQLNVDPAAALAAVTIALQHPQDLGPLGAH